MAQKAAQKPGRRFDWWGFAILATICTAVWFLWDTNWVYPLKLVVVFLHEISHGLAALATGGRVVEIQVQQGEGGHCVTSGGNGPLIYSAGYLGSLLFGVALLLVATRTRTSRPIAAILGVVLAATAARFIPWEANRFGKTFGVLTGALLVAFGALPRAWPAGLLRVIAVTSCLYAVLDIKSDVLDRPGLDSDAARLATVTPLSTTAWGVIWIVVSLLVSSWAFWTAVTGAPPRKRVDSVPRGKR